MSYISKHTGAQVDEAVSKVLNGEVGNSNWDAKVGETGYIENRTHYMEYYNVAKNSTESKSYLGREYDENDDYIDYDAAILRVHGDIGDIEYKFRKKDLKWDENYGDYERKTIIINEDGDISDYGKLTVTSRFVDGDYDFYIDISSDGYLYYDLSFYNTKTLDIDYLPNTCLQTTPQELEDADKNQALTNLGIDPVVLKYVCKPYELLLGTTGERVGIPTDLRNIIISNNAYIKHTAYNCMVVIDDDINYYPIKHIYNNYFTFEDSNNNTKRVCWDTSIKAFYLLSN